MVERNLAKVEFVTEDCPPLRIEIPYTGGVDLHNLLEACMTREPIRQQTVWTPYLTDLLGALCDAFHPAKPRVSPGGTLSGGEEP